mmetsp:Transcript_79863/g.209712  ORF Transcript_79863/g.209712 Transcript_79863/m.209712 type:complete len:230 (-) Transcript_79863:671-1360(-)
MLFPGHKGKLLHQHLAADGLRQHRGGLGLDELLLNFGLVLALDIRQLGLGVLQLPLAEPGPRHRGPGGDEAPQRLEPPLRLVLRLDQLRLLGLLAPEDEERLQLRLLVALEHQHHGPPPHLGGPLLERDLPPGVQQELVLHAELRGGGVLRDERQHGLVGHRLLGLARVPLGPLLALLDAGLAPHAVDVPAPHLEAVGADRLLVPAPLHHREANLLLLLLLRPDDGQPR